MSNYELIGFSFASDWLREWREFSGPMRMKYNKNKEIMDYS